MATFQAIAATSEALRRLLEDAADLEPDLELEVKHARAQDFKTVHTTRVITLYLYHIGVNTNRRSLPPRTTLDGRRFRPPVPVDLHFLVTAWGSDALAQQELLGWCVRVLEDTLILPTGLLNRHTTSTDVFHREETVELAAETVSATDMARIWEMAPSSQQPSLSYVARMVTIEPDVELFEGPLVRTREFALGKLVEP